MTALIIIIVGVLLFYLLTNNKGGEQPTNNNSTNKSESTIFELEFPDRNPAVDWHFQAIQKGIQEGNFELVNLSYAKLIESMSQQSINQPNKYDDLLNSVRQEYEVFRTHHNFEYPEQFLPPKERKKTKKKAEDLVNVSSKSEGTTTSFTINLNREELERRLKNKESKKSVPDVADISGFYGSKNLSTNKEFCVTNSQKGDFAVLHNDSLLYKKKLKRPNDCLVSNNGISVCSDWLNFDGLDGKFLVFNPRGQEIFSIQTTANLGKTGISENGEIALFETYNSTTDDADKIFIIDVKEAKVISKFFRPFAFVNCQIDTSKNRIQLIDNKQFIFEIDYLGNQTNKEDYEAQILTKGSVHDKLWFYMEKPEKENFKDKNYLDLLTLATKDKEAKYAFGADRIYRLIGEYYEANNNIEQTIANWERAISINPKVGIKRKLDKLKGKQ